MNPKLKSILDATWKVGVGIVGLIAALVLVAFVYERFDRRFGRGPWGDKYLSKDVTARYFKNGRTKVYNEADGRYTTGKVRWVSSRPEHDSLTVYCDEDYHRGYLNCNTGEIVIPSNKAKYDRAWHFSGGSAFVVLEDEDRLSVIDSQGNVIHHGVATFRPGFDYVFDGDGLCKLFDGSMYGLLRSDGTWALEMKYHLIQSPVSGGCLIARDSAGCWLFDGNFNKVFAEPYDAIDYAVGRVDGAGDLFVSRGHVKQLINCDGTVVEPFVIDGTYDLYYLVGKDEYDCEEYELVPDLAVYRVDSWEGLLDRRTGVRITAADYTDFTMISKDLIRAELDTGPDTQSVILDKRGRVVR